MASKKQTVRFGPLKRFIANGVRSGDLITLSGQVSLDAKGTVVGPGDLRAQVEQTYANVREVLDHFGASMDDIVDEMWLVMDAPAVTADAEAIWKIRESAYGREPDVTQTMVQVAALVMPELLIEIKCIART